MTTTTKMQELGAMLQRYRVQRSFTTTRIANIVGAKPAIIEAFEHGTAVPNGQQWMRYVNMLARGLREHRPLWVEALKEAHTAEPERVATITTVADLQLKNSKEIDPGAAKTTTAEPPAVLRPEDAPTFGEALHRCRLLSGCTQREIDELLGLSTAVGERWLFSRWEDGTAEPSPIVRATLVSLFPELARWVTDQAAPRAGTKTLTKEERDAAASEARRKGIQTARDANAAAHERGMVRVREIVAACPHATAQEVVDLLAREGAQHVGIPAIRDEIRRVYPDQERQGRRAEVDAAKAAKQLARVARAPDSKSSASGRDTAPPAATTRVSPSAPGAAATTSKLPESHEPPPRKLLPADPARPGEFRWEAPKATRLTAKPEAIAQRQAFLAAKQAQGDVHALGHAHTEALLHEARVKADIADAEAELRELRAEAADARKATQEAWERLGAAVAQSAASAAQDDEDAA